MVGGDDVLLEEVAAGLLQLLVIVLLLLLLLEEVADAARDDILDPAHKLQASAAVRKVPEKTFKSFCSYFYMGGQCSKKVIGMGFKSGEYFL